MGDLDHVVIILFNQKYMDYSHSKCSSYAHVLTNKSKMYVMNCTQYTVRLTYRTIILIQNFNKTTVLPFWNYEPLKRTPITLYAFMEFIKPCFDI